MDKLGSYIKFEFVKLKRILRAISKFSAIFLLHLFCTILVKLFQLLYFDVFIQEKRQMAWLVKYRPLFRWWGFYNKKVCLRILLHPMKITLATLHINTQTTRTFETLYLKRIDNKVSCTIQNSRITLLSQYLLMADIRKEYMKTIWKIKGQYVLRQSVVDLEKL